MSSYEYNQLLKFLYFEGYADSYEEAEYILEDMSDDEFEELIEIRTQKPWSASETARFNREIERQKKQLKKTPNSSLRPGDQAALKRMIAREQSPTRSASKPDPTPTTPNTPSTTSKPKRKSEFVDRSGASDQGNRGSRRIREEREDFDIITEFLFVEGFAETIENAEVMAENISEDWVEEILDEKHVKAMDTTKRGADHRTRFPKFKGKDDEFDPKFTQQRVRNNNKKIDPYYNGRRERKDKKRQGTGGFSS